MTPFEKIIAIRKIKNVSSGEKLVLLTIATHLGENDFCYLSLTTLQHECCLARDNVSSNISKLIARNYLKKIAPSKSYKSNQFIINFTKILEEYSCSKNATSSETLLVAKHYHTSSETLLDQERNTTRLVVKHYPKEQLNKYKRKLNNNKLEKAVTPVDNISQENKDHVKKKNLEVEEMGTMQAWEVFPEYAGVKQLPMKDDDVKLDEDGIGSRMFWE